jgi:hypothetical protein
MKLKLDYRSRRFTPTVCAGAIADRGHGLRVLRTAVEAEFSQLRDRNGHLLRLTLNEAEALAAQTAFPNLVFPVLAEEKLSALKSWHQRQALLRSQESVLSFPA